MQQTSDEEGSKSPSKRNDSLNDNWRGARQIMKKYVFTNQFLSKTKTRKKLKLRMDQTKKNKKRQETITHRKQIPESLPHYLTPLTEAPKKGNVRMYFQNANTLKIFRGKKSYDRR